MPLAYIVGMRTILLSEQDDARLEAIAPDYLRGEKMIARRVQWGIARLCELLNHNNTTPAGRPRNGETADDITTPGTT